MAKKKRFQPESVDAWISIGGRVLGWLVAAGAAVIAYFVADASNWMEQNKPWSQYLAALIAGALVSFCLAALSLARRWWVSASLDSKFLERNHVNPTKRVFENERVSFSDLVNPITGRIAGKIFTGCELMGPANIIAHGGGSFSGCGFGNCDLVAVKENQYVRNVIVLESCTFRDCMFYQCTLLGTKAFFDRMQAAMPAPHPVISETYGTADQAKV